MYDTRRSYTSSYQKGTPLTLKALFSISQILFFKVVSLLPPWFQKNSNSGNNDDRIYNDKTSMEERLKAAYAFMDVQPPVTKEELRKQYRRLSLQYHPDRNGGSEEAKEKFQMLAASNELIEKHIAGDCRDDNHENNNQNQQDSDNDNDEGSAHSMSNEEKEEHFRRWEHEMQKEDERRLYEDFKKEQEELNEFKKKKSKVMNKCRKNYRKHNLNTEEGCHRAHEEFCKQANDFEAELSSSSSQRSTQSMDNIDSDDNNHKRKEQKHKAPKPQNIMMENNLNGDIVLALKMGYTNLAISLFFHSYIQEQLLLTTPLDKDGNTIAHYVVYFESYEFLEFLCHDLFRERLMELKYVLTFENHRGHSPLFYARFADDIRIQELIQSQVDLAEEIMKKTGSRTARIEKLASKIKIVTKSALSLMLSIELWDIAVTFVLGRFVFHTSFLYTFLCFQTSKYVGYLKCGIAATVGHYGFGLGFLHSVGAMILMGFLMNCCYSFDDISYDNH